MPTETGSDQEPKVGTPEWVLKFTKIRPGASQAEKDIAAQNIRLWKQGKFGPDGRQSSSRPPTRTGQKG